MLSCQRSLFSLPEDVHYLNCAYMSPLARPVEEAGIAGMRLKRVPSDILPPMFFEDCDRARTLFASLIHAAPERVALIPAASYGLATAARNLPLRTGDNVVLVAEQFPSNVYVWQRCAREAGAEVRMVDPPSDDPSQLSWTDRILGAIDARTRAVALSPLHWADGTRFDLDAISAHAQTLDVALIVDGTQAVGALPFDAGRLKPDAVICAAYKWLFGPYSIGLAYYGPRFDDGIPLEENWIARLGSEDFSGLVRYQDAYQPGAVRFDAGGRSNFILVPMLVAALELVLSWGPERIQAYCADLVAPLLDDAEALGIRVPDATARSAHLFGLRLPHHQSAALLQSRLRERRVHVSLRGNALRISPHVYNHQADVDALRDALREGLTRTDAPSVFN